MWSSDFPSVITANTTVKWRDGAATVPFNTTATEGDGWALTYYLRTNTASEGATVTGSSWNGSGWEFTIASSVTTNFDAGEWFWTAIVSKGSESFQLARGEFTVKQALAYSGTPGAVDDRTQNEIDFDKLNGLVGIFGKNYSGKSSIIDAALFGLFNTTSKGERKNVRSAEGGR